MEAREFKIMIADRNPHVREYLKREFEAAGYKVLVAKDGRQILKRTEGRDSPDLLILDLDMPYVNGPGVLEDISNRNPAMPVIVHTFLTEYIEHPAVKRTAGFWEKRGDNIDGFKTMVKEVLQQWYPQRFARQQVQGWTTGRSPKFTC